MARDSNGVYTLPSGNPVVEATDIEVDWANPTMDDLAAEIQDSLSRSGKGNMTAVFKSVSGAITAPGLTWVGDEESGLYLAAVDDVRMAINQLDLMKWIPAGPQVLVGAAFVDVIQKALGVSYDNTVSGLTAADVKAALDEIQGNVQGGGSFELIYNITVSPTALVASTAYAFDSSSGSLTMTLPASPALGAEIPFTDYAGTFATNNIKLARNGQNIFGVAEDHDLNINRLKAELKYIDVTQGWVY